MRQAKKKARKPLILLGLRAIEFWEALIKKIPSINADTKPNKKKAPNANCVSRLSTV